MTQFCGAKSLSVFDAGTEIKESPDQFFRVPQKISNKFFFAFALNQFARWRVEIGAIFLLSKLNFFSCKIGHQFERYQEFSTEFLKGYICIKRLASIKFDGKFSQKSEKTGFKVRLHYKEQQNQLCPR